MFIFYRTFSKVYANGVYMDFPVKKLSNAFTLPTVPMHVEFYLKIGQIENFEMNK